MPRVTYATIETATIEAASRVTGRALTEADLSRDFGEIGLDSLAVIGIVGEVEEDIGLTFDLDQMRDQACLRDVIEAFERVVENLDAATAAAPAPAPAIRGL